MWTSHLQFYVQDAEKKKEALSHSSFYLISAIYSASQIPVTENLGNKCASKIGASVLQGFRQRNCEVVSARFPDP